MIALRRFALSLAAAMTACASDGEDGAGSSTGTGGSEGSSSSADESSSSISSDESGTSSDACAVDVVANGECRSQGDACTHLDFACECDCDCAMLHLACLGAVALANGTNRGERNKAA